MGNCVDKNTQPVYKYCTTVNNLPTTRRLQMAWNTPKVAEVACGMEINMYAKAALK